jgi:hypothetical protein
LRLLAKFETQKKGKSRSETKTTHSAWDTKWIGYFFTVPKFKIAAKEMEETDFWLTLCNRYKNYPTVKDLFEDLIVIKKVINKIIGSSKTN